LGDVYAFHSRMTKLIVLFVIAFVDMVGLAMVLPLLPFYASSLGVSAAGVGILVSSFSIAQLASAPFWGRLSDRHGRRRALLFGLLITSVAYVLFALADSLALLLVSRVMQGLGGGTIGVVQAYVVDSSSSRERTKALGWLSAVSSLGAVVGPAFGSAMITLGGRAAPGFAAAGLAALVTAFGWWQLENADVAPSVENTRGLNATTEFGAVKHVLTRWRSPAPRLILTYAIAIGAFYGTVPIMPLLLQSRLGVTEQTIGYTIMYLGGVGVLVRSMLLGRMIARFGEDRLSRTGLVLLSAGLVLLGVTHNYTTLLLSLTLMPLGTAFLFPAVTARLSRTVAHDRRGLYMGVQHTYGGASRVAFPILTGLAMDHVGSGVPFIAAAAMVLAVLRLLPSEETVANAAITGPVTRPSVEFAN